MEWLGVFITALCYSPLLSFILIVYLTCAIRRKYVQFLIYVFEVSKVIIIISRHYHKRANDWLAFTLHFICLQYGKRRIAKAHRLKSLDREEEIHAPLESEHDQDKEKHTQDTDAIQNRANGNSERKLGTRTVSVFHETESSVLQTAKRRLSFSESTDVSLSRSYSCSVLFHLLIEIFLFGNIEFALLKVLNVLLGFAGRVGINCGSTR